MIGKVKFSDGTVAELDDSGKWTCDDELYEAKLNLSFAPRNFPFLGMPYGWNAVAQAALRMGGRAEISGDLEPVPDGAVT